MSNSSLVNCTVISPNKNSPRNHKIDTITPHCVVGQLSAESIGGCFTSRGRQASCNYGIGNDGRIVLVVDEKDRSWCTSSSSNDNRAVTIECASDKTSPYAMNGAVYESLVRLCADICKRNGIQKLLWLGSKEMTLSYTPKSGEAVLTAHRWFANKSCPGDWLYTRYGDLAIRVNALLGTGGTVDKPGTSQSCGEMTAVPVKSGDVIYQAFAAGKWWDYVTNWGSGTEGYAGVIGKSMNALRAYVKGDAKSVGYLEYRFHLLGGGWYNWQRDREKDKNGENFAGDCKNRFDGLQMRLVGISGKHVRYRVHAIGKGWLDWVTDYGPGDNGYAGWYGFAIDAVQIEKVS